MFFELNDEEYLERSKECVKYINNVHNEEQLCELIAAEQAKREPLDGL